MRQFLEREQLPASLLQTVAAVHEPLARRIAAASQSRSPPYVVGVCGPQGSGKSTLVRILQLLLEARGVKSAILSLDDLYLSRAERSALAERVHPLLRTRGVPGTHDVALGIRVLDALGREGDVELPAFDKALDDRSDRVSHVTGPVQVVLFEGWCVGAQPQSLDELAEPLNDLERGSDPDGTWRRYVNDALAGEYQTLFRKIDSLMLLKPPGFGVVYDWRAEQEHKLRRRIEAAGGDTSRLLSDVELRRFIAHYERLTQHILSEMPSRADIVIELDAMRRPVGGLARNRL